MRAPEWFGIFAEVHGLQARRRHGGDDLAEGLLSFDCPVSRERVVHVAAAEVTAILPDPRLVLVPRPQDHCRMRLVDEQVPRGPATPPPAPTPPPGCCPQSRTPMVTPPATPTTRTGRPTPSPTPTARPPPTPTTAPITWPAAPTRPGTRPPTGTTATGGSPRSRTRSAIPPPTPTTSPTTSPR